MREESAIFAETALKALFYSALQKECLNPRRPNRAIYQFGGAKTEEFLHE